MIACIIYAILPVLVKIIYVRFKYYKEYLLIITLHWYH